MPARKNRIFHPETVRNKIRAGLLVQRLRDHALGKLDMSKTQVTAALGLLKKTLPDLSSVDMAVRGETFVEALERVNRERAHRDGGQPTAGMDREPGEVRH